MLYPYTNACRLYSRHRAFLHFCLSRHDICRISHNYAGISIHSEHIPNVPLLLKSQYSVLPSLMRSFTLGHAAPLKRHVSRINVAISSNLLLGMPNINSLARTLGRTDGSKRPMKQREPRHSSSMITCRMVVEQPLPHGVQTASSEELS